MLIKRKKHSVPQLNTTATADISFMLLTFFLVTTSMDVDHGLVRKLPPADQQNDDSEAAEMSRANVLQFRIDADNIIWLNNQRADINTLRQQIALFVEKRGAEHAIYIDTHPEAHYNTYFVLEDAIVGGYADARNAMAQNKYRRQFLQLTEEQKQDIRNRCPQRISETYNTFEQKGGTNK